MLIPNTSSLRGKAMKRGIKEIGIAVLTAMIVLGLSANAPGFFQSEPYSIESRPAGNLRLGGEDSVDAWLKIYSVPGWGSIIAKESHIEFNSRTGTGGLSITIDTALLDHYAGEEVLMVWNPMRDYAMNKWHDFTIRENAYGRQVVDYVLNGLYLGQYSLPIESYSGPHPLAPLPYITLQKRDLVLSEGEQFYFNEIGQDDIPIPGTVWLLGSVLAGLFGFRKKLMTN